jgi:hypothetical protein
MRNITVCIPDEIYLQARICAARSGLSVSALVRRFFESLLELPAPLCGYSIFDSALFRNVEAEWLFSQEKATLHRAAMSICESKML